MYQRFGNSLIKWKKNVWRTIPRAFKSKITRSSSRQFSSTIIRYNHDESYQEFIAKLPNYVGGNVELELNSDNGCGFLKIDNPKSKNALTGFMITELNDIVNQLGSWRDGKAVIVYGTNNQFCSGGDLRYFMNHMKTPQDGEFMCRYMQDLMMRFTKLPFLTVAVIQGSTLGGGAELATGCDFRVMQHDAVIAFVQLQRGITTGFGGYTRLVRLIGATNAMKLLLSATKLPASEAKELKLVDEIFPCNVNVRDWCINWMTDQKLLNVDAKLVQGVKAMAITAVDESLEDSYNFERSIFKTFWQGELHKRALKSDTKFRP